MSAWACPRCHALEHPGPRRCSCGEMTVRVEVGPAPMPDDSTATWTCDVCHEVVESGDLHYHTRREDAAGERLYPKPASAEEAAAFARDLENAPPSTIDDGFDWLDASDAEPILDPELREQFMGQVQAMKTGSPFLKTLVLRYDKTVRALLAEHAAALSTAEREREADALDAKRWREIREHLRRDTWAEDDEPAHNCTIVEFAEETIAWPGFGLTIEQVVDALALARVPSGGET